MPAAPVPVPTGPAGNIRDFNIYKSASLAGMFDEVIPLLESKSKLPVAVEALPVAVEALPVAADAVLGVVVEALPLIGP